MNNQLQSYIDRYNEARERMRTLTTDLTDDTFNKCPPTGGWSLAEIVHHLCVIGEQLLPRIDVGIDEARARGWHDPGPYRYPFFSRLFIRGVGPLSANKRGKMKAPGPYMPTANHRMEDILPRFDKLQTGLIARCQRADGVDIARVVIASPAAAWIRVRLGAWFEALAMHQLRHFQQFEETRIALGLSPHQS